MPPRIDASVFTALGNAIAPPPPPKKKSSKADEPWAPRLGPQQQLAFDSPARYILCDGEKGSGKTHGLLHKLVRHAYENRNALCLILVRVRAMATKGGAWDKLTQQILPAWRDGNRDKHGKLLDDGLGIEFSDVKFDSQHNEYLWIENQYGEWSMVVLISAPHAHQLRERIRGYEPSFVLVDELTSCPSPEYLVAVGAQVGRRPGIEGVQQYTAACNPDGPSHWVWKRWFKDNYDEETGEYDPDYARFHIPIADNKANLPDGYIESLEKLYRGDPIERARMMGGEWIDMPSGDALFRDVWIPLHHIKPEPNSNLSILPFAHYPFVIGMDPGSSYNAFIFMQYVLTRWFVFDEIVTIRQRLRYDRLIPIVLRRVAWWASVVRHQAGNPKLPIPVVYVSDNSAFNQFRAASGSFDVLEMQKCADLHTPRLGLPQMRVRQAPKFKGSVPSRSRMTMDLLAQDQLIVSARCKRVTTMFDKLEAETQDPSKFDPEVALTPKRSDHIHTFDAMTYPILTQAISPQILAPRASDVITIVRMKS